MAKDESRLSGAVFDWSDWGIPSTFGAVTSPAPKVSVPKGPFDALNKLGSMTPLGALSEYLFKGSSDAASSSGGTISIWDKFNDYLLRGTVIVLGFIFVAVGLSLFRVPIIIPGGSVAEKVMGR